MKRRKAQGSLKNLESRDLQKGRGRAVGHTQKAKYATTEKSKRKLGSTKSKEEQKDGARLAAEANRCERGGEEKGDSSLLKLG